MAKMVVLLQGSGERTRQCRAALWWGCVGVEAGCDRKGSCFSLKSEATEVVEDPFSGQFDQMAVRFSVGSFSALPRTADVHDPWNLGGTSGEPRATILRILA
jgi:hypothetical protein